MTTMANQEMAEAWEREAEGWLAHADRYDEAGKRQWARFVAAVDVPADAAVLDVGCGGGRTTIDVARMAPAGSATGVDISLRMIEHARRVAEEAGVANVAFVHADAQVHAFPDAAYDLAISSFGTMFFADPAAAFGNVRRSLRPGGRLAVLVWRPLAENEWLTSLRGALALGRDLPLPPPDAPGPFSLAREGRVREVLGVAGFDGIELEPLDEPMSFGRDADDAFPFLQTFGLTKGLTEGLDAADRDRAMASLRSMVEAHETDDGVLFGTAAWLVTATA
jgi:SAM-dependent methyltransferase